MGDRGERISSKIHMDENFVMDRVNGPSTPDASNPERERESERERERERERDGGCALRPDIGCIHFNYPIGPSAHAIGPSGFA